MTEGQKSHDDTRGPGLHLLSTCVPGAERAAVITANGMDAQLSVLASERGGCQKRSTVQPSGARPPAVLEDGNAN